MNRILAPPLSPLELRAEMRVVPIQDDPNQAVFLLEGGTERIAKIDIVFPAGTRHEKVPMTANFCLSMLTKGTKNYSAQRIAEAFDYHGTRFSVSLDKDRAKVTIVSLLDQLDAVLPILREVLRDPIFPSDEFEILKKQRKSALEINLQKVQFKCRLAFSDMFYRNHPYKESISVESIERLTRDHLLDFYKTHIIGSESFLIFSGADTREVYSKWSNCFGKSSSYSQESKTQEFEDLTFEPRSNLINEEGHLQSAIRIGTMAAGRDHSDYPALLLANAILGGAFSSRLMQNIREEKGYTYGINSSLNVHELTTSWLVRTEAGAQFTLQTIDEVAKECRGMMHELVSEEELEMAKRYITAGIIREFDGPFPKSERLDILIRSDLPFSYFNVLSKEIQNIDPKDILEVSQKYFNPDNFVVAAVGTWD